MHYGTFLIVSYVLFLFVLELDLTQRVLLFSIITLHSIQQFMVVIGNYIGGFIASIIYIANPTTYSYVLFLCLIIYTLNKISKSLNNSRQFSEF